MNCPMCGSPLGDNDQMCLNCGTKRSEMGPAYNNAPSQQGGYGRSYNSGGYGGTGYNNGGNYGAGGSNGYGTNNNYNSYGYNNTPQMNSPSAVRSANPNSKLIGIIVGVIVLLLAIGYFQYMYNTPYRETVGDISVTFPQRVSSSSDHIFNSTGADGGEFYSNRNMGFAYIKYDLGEFGLTDDDVKGLETLFINDMDAEFTAELDGYKRKDQVDDHLRFYFDDEGDSYFADMKVEVHDGSFYMYIAYCEKSKEKTYIAKFRKMYDSIEYI